MRTWFWMNTVGALVLAGVYVPVMMKPEADRSMHREAAVAAVSAGWEWTNFGCLHGTVCGETAGYQFCAEDVVIADGKIGPIQCDGIDATSWRLAFDPPMTSLIVLWLEGVDPWVHCWNNPKDVGDKTLGFRLEPVEPVEPGEIYMEAGIRQTAQGPVAACEINATVSSIVVYRLR